MKKFLKSKKIVLGLLILGTHLSSAQPTLFHSDNRMKDHIEVSEEALKDAIIKEETPLEESKAFIAPAQPPAPIIVSQTCSSAELQKTGTIPTGEMWYWQNSKYGTDTSFPATSNYIVNASGTYVIRPLDLASNTWGRGNNVIVTLDPNAGSNWYLDTDGDGLGDPNHTIFQCLQPFGYVSNSDDQCPDVAGGSAQGGCEAEDPDNQNYVYTITARVPTTDIDTLKSTTNGIENVTYFDGLGRPKQSVAVDAGGGLTDKNALLYDWTLGNAGSTSFYTQEGTDAENTIVNGTTPFGNTDLLWECKDTNGGGGAGWITDPIAIDKTKAYRYTVWVKRTHSNDGNTLFGTHVVAGLDGTNYGEKYFFLGDLPQMDTWYLLVGMIHPYDHTAGDQGIGGVYDTQGNKVLDADEYKWQTTSTVGRFRSYLFTGNALDRQYFWSPLVQKMDGNELSISDVLNASGVITPEGSFADIVTHLEYDQYGRQLKEYLPFAVSSNNGQYRTGDMTLVTQTYYKSKHANDFANSIISEVNAYSEKTIENSPLGRIFEQTAPGEDWKRGANNITGKDYSDGHSIRFEYNTNTATEVKLYNVSLSFANNTYTPTLTGGSTNYPVGELSKTTTKDENWVVADGVNHTTEEFKDKNGQVILKRTYNNSQAHDTYYVYDDYGNLTYVLPPKMDGGSASLSTVISTLDNLGYQYKYDQRNRLIEKKIPGKGWEYIVYDKLDRPVMTQDANQRAKSPNEWLFTKYDILGRVVYTGMAENNSTRIALQGTYNQGTYPMYEDRASTNQNFGGAVIYYSKTAYPTSMKEVHTINYYDSYEDLPSGFTTPGAVYGVTPTTIVKTLPTVSKVRVLGTTNWTTTVSYYDEKARPVYVYSNNAYLGTTDIIESKLDDFTGKVLETKSTHQKTGNTDVIVTDRFEYDHMDRLINQTQKVNNQTTDRLVKNNYDELGQLESKLVGNGTQKGYKDVTSGISISEDVITKTSANGWNEGLATLGSIQKDGYVVFEAVQDNLHLMVGLSATNQNADYSTIAYAIYNGGNELKVYENNTNKGSFGTYVVGDVFRVERIGNQVYYKKNGAVFYVSLIPSTGILLGDISIHGTGAKVKNLNIIDNSEGLQKVDYTYNVRGWLKNINSDSHNDNDLFNFNLKYNDITDISKKLFNGNISQTSWNTLNTDTSTRTYTYSYDALNRIVSGMDNTGNYSLEEVQYDKNGNITFLNREGAVNIAATVFDVMDELDYFYESNSNKLIKVADGGNTQFGFKDGSNSGNDYTYDVNGNMISDGNKGITNIYYNHLNLPTSIFFGNSGSVKEINYVYDATGNKLRKEVIDETIDLEKITDYAGNHIYEDGTLQFFNHVEGYTKNDNGTLSNVYQYKDHLGNVRLSYADSNNDGVISTGAVSTIHESDFNDTTDVTPWRKSFGDETLAIDTDRLKCTIDQNYKGTYINMNLEAGKTYQVTYTVDLSATNIDFMANVYGPTELYNSGYFAQGGTFTFTFTALATAQYKLRFYGKDIAVTDGVIYTQAKDFYIDNVSVYEFDATTSEIVEESNYYPFGLKHKGYNNVVSSNGNSTAQKFKFNGMELENSLGIDWYEMDVRQYDPAIARWTSIDPVTHHSMSTYTAFDNNPVYFADPSGADSQVIKDFDGKEWTVDCEAGECSNEREGDHVTNPSKKELETIASDLNGIYQDKYGSSPFSVEKQTRKRKVKVKDGGWFGKDEYKEEEYDVYVLKGSIGFDWEKDKYTKALYEIINSKEDILVDIISDKGKIYKKMKFKTGRGHLSDFGGGSTDSKNRISLSNALSIYSSTNSHKWTIGGVALHELLFHISPNKSLNEGANILREYYKIKTGTDHERGNRINKKIK